MERERLLAEASGLSIQAEALWHCAHDLSVEFHETADWRGSTDDLNRYAQIITVARHVASAAEAARALLDTAARAG